MNPHTTRAGLTRRLASILAASLLCGAFHAAAAPAGKAARSASADTSAPLAPCSSTAVAEPALLTLGKSTLVRLPSPVTRMVVGGIGATRAGKPEEGPTMKATPMPGMQQVQQATDSHKTGVADVDVVLLSPTELYLLGKRVGSMNLILQDSSGRCTVKDITVGIDPGALQAKFAQIMPDERNIKVAAAQDTLILSGEVGDPVKIERAMMLASAFAPERRLVNMMRSSAANQVMLEVKVAEVSKTLLDKLGAQVQTTSGGKGWQYSLFSSFLTNGGGLIEALKTNKGVWQIDGEKSDGIVRILAEPNLMAVSGQQASFLSGGKIFIPVAQTNNGGLGGTTITLEEKEFGVGLKFLPTVLDGGRINLKVASEVSELSQTGSPFTTVGGYTAVLPSMSTRRADTSVQLRDGQSFAIAGLIKNNITESMKRFPGLGEIPLLGALFRSAEFQRDMTELLFIITPRLVKPLPANYALPTDNFKEPTRGEFLIGGKLEGSPDSADSKRKPDAPVYDSGAAAPAADDAAPAIAQKEMPAAPAAASVPAEAPKPALPSPVSIPAKDEAAAAETAQPVATTQAVVHEPPLGTALPNPIVTTKTGKVEVAARSRRGERP